MNKDSKKKFEIFPWSEHFKTGLVEIDNQHKYLLFLINNLAISLTNKENLETKKLFDELVSYANYHFEYEESVWVNCIEDKETISSHLKQHNEFLPQIQKIKENSKHDSSDKVSEEILLFLIKWLAYHILEEDKRLAIVVKALNDGQNLNKAKAISNEIMADSMRIIIDSVLSMYDKLSIKALELIRERKAREEAELKLKKLNKKLEKISVTDQLTNISNRRYFDITLKKKLKKSKKEKLYLNLAIFDIDYFKKLNDTYGHARGDEVLQVIGKELRKLSKKTKIKVFRIGGEEFAMISVDRRENDFINQMKIFKDTIEELKTPNVNSKVSDFLTISMGVTSKIPTKGDSIEDLFKKTDEKLYEAKIKGRNNICF